ncbi:hypothetical protein PBRA_002888 [Plasmodiophora brassicae]|nr:hypothetical protein PBRA_002888 [Plasmodiophora brassicae]
MEKNETRQRGAKDDDVVVARDTQKDAVVVVGAGAGPATGRRIRSSLHMIFVMQLLRKEVGNDVNAFGPVFEHEAGAGFSAVQTASSTYFPLVWADFRAFLSDATADIEVLRARYGNSPDALDPYIFKLYNELSDLYEFFAPHADLPDIVVGEHFAPFVDRWLEIQREHFSTTRIDSALNSDQWVALQDTKCTTSVIDLYAMLYPLADAFKSAPFSSEQSVTFAGLLSDIVCHYVHRLAVMLDADMTAWPGRVTDVMVLRFNDMHICKVKLSDLLKAIDLEKAYGKPPTLVDNDGQPGGGAGDDDAEFKAFMSDAIGGSSLDALRCSGSFRFMQDAMNGAAHKIAVPMNKLWSALITELVWRKPLTDAMDDDAVEAFLQPFWEDLAAKVEPLVAAMIEPHVLLRAFLAHLLVDVEGNLVPQSRKTVLNPAQLGRLRSAHQLMQEFFMFYGLPSNVLDAMKVNARATFLIQLQSGPTANLIGVWDAIPDDDESMPEEERIKAPPYLGRKHVRRILERRKRDAADPDADAFLKDHKKKGWF